MKIEFVIMSLCKDDNRLMNVDYNKKIIPNIHIFKSINGYDKEDVIMELKKTGLEYHNLYFKTYGTLACFLTKYNCLQYQIENNISYMCFIEDDLKLSKRFPEFAKEKSKVLIKKKCDIVRLGKWGEGYITSLESAKKIISLIKKYGIFTNVNLQLRSMGIRESVVKKYTPWKLIVETNKGDCLKTDKFDNNDDIKDLLRKKSVNFICWKKHGDRGNFGDEMTHFITKKLLDDTKFGLMTNSSKHCDYTLISIGSYIHESKNNTYIYGSGASDNSMCICKQNKLNVCALRGPFTKKLLHDNGLLDDTDVPFGDPGLLMSEFYKPKNMEHVNGKLILIPHHTLYDTYTNKLINLKNIIIVDPHKSFFEICDYIFSAECVISSSLHGLVCSDSYNKPNIWIREQLENYSHFKFEDYYASQNKKLKYIEDINDLTKSTYFNAVQIGNNVNLKNLVSVFPFGKMRREKCICFICVDPEKLIKFAEELQNNNPFYDVIILCDNIHCQVPETNIQIVKITDDESASNNFIYANEFIKKIPSGWDKVLYYFSCINNDYDYVWIIEEDVFIPSVKTIRNIDNNHSNCDFIVSNHRKYQSDGWINYKFVENMDMLGDIWISMVCCCRVSRKMFSLIKEFVKDYKRLFFIEAFLNTISEYNKLIISTPIELQYICSKPTKNRHRHYYKKNNKTVFDWLQNEILDPNVNMIYHPVKDIDLHYKLRRKIDEKNKSNLCQYIF